MARFVSFASLLFLVAIGGHFSGMFASDRQMWTADLYVQAKEAIKAWRSIDRTSANPLRTTEPFQRKGAMPRFIELEDKGPPIIIPGGEGIFTDLCPGTGCLAVVFGRDGQAVRTVPFLAEEISDAPRLADAEGRYLGAGFSADLSVAGIRAMENGDLLVTFNLQNAFPYSYGLMRVSPAGKVRWARADFANHRASVGPDGLIYTPLHVIRQGHIYRQANGPLAQYVSCAPSARQYADYVQVLSADGKEIRKIALLDLLLAHPGYRSIVSRTLDPCDPLHLNSVDVADAQDAAATDWLDEGDMIVSFRALSAVVIIAADGSRVKRLVTGSFHVQHSAHFLGNGEIILFDNMGGDDTGLPSRIMAIDLATGGERVIHARSPDDEADLSEYTPFAGDIALSRDKSRALVSFTRGGRMVELDIGTGEILSRYDHTQANGEIVMLYASDYGLGIGDDGSEGGT